MLIIFVGISILNFVTSKESALVSIIAIISLAVGYLLPCWLWPNFKSLKQNLKQFIAIIVLGPLIGLAGQFIAGVVMNAPTTFISFLIQLISFLILIFITLGLNKLVIK